MSQNDLYWTQKWKIACANAEDSLKGAQNTIKGQKRPNKQQLTKQWREKIMQVEREDKFLFLFNKALIVFYFFPEGSSINF